MADDFNTSFNLVVSTKGIDTAEGLLKALQQSLDDAVTSGAKAGQELGTDLATISKAVKALETSMGTGSGKVKKYAEGFKDLVDNVAKATAELREAAQLNVVGGSTSPLQDMAGSMGLEEAQKILATRTAMGLTAEQVAQKVVSSHEKEVAAAEKAAKAEAAAAEKAAKAEIAANEKATKEKARADEKAEKERQARIAKAAAEQKKLEAAVTSAKGNLSNAQKNKMYAEEERGLTAVQVATLRVKRATEELNAARLAEHNAGSNKAKQAAALNAQADATRKLASAQGQLHAAGAAAGEGTKDLAGSLPRLRYALYDVSSTFAIAGAAALGLATAVVGTSIAMDRDFANVVRTTGTYMDKTGDQTAALRQEFDALFTSLPTSWGALTDIGTLAGQLNVPTEAVAEFTSLVAKFAATTDVSVDQAATAFGRLSELLNVMPEQYENLGSSILNVGVNSVATESQIINTSAQIASMGSFAGFTADEVIGLSAALSSLGIAPELARGTVTRLFTNIGVAVEDNTKKLDAFGEVAGMTGDAFADAWGTDASGALEDLLSGLGKLSDADASRALKDLGISASRDIPTILKLAQNSDVLTESLLYAKDGFTEGTALSDQYGVTAETVASKLTILKNNITELISNIGGASSALGPVIDGITAIVNGLGKLAENKAAQWVMLIGLAFTALSGILLIVGGGVARTIASFYALQTAATAAGGGINYLKIALVSSGIGLALVAAGTAIAYFVGQADKMNNVEVSGLAEAIKKDSEVYKETGEGFAYMAEQATLSADKIKDFDSKAQENGGTLGLSDALKGVSTNFDDVEGSAAKAQIAVGDFTEEWLRNELSNSDFGKALAESGVATQAETDALVRSIMGDPANATATITAWLEEVTGKVPDSIGSLFGSVDVSTFADDIDVEGFDSLLTLATDLGAAFTDAGNQLLASDLFNNMGEGAGDAEQAMDDLLTSTLETLGVISEGVNVINASESAIYDLGGSLYENGAAWSAFSNEGRANIGSLMSVMDALAKQAGGSTQETAADFQALYEFLLNGNFATAESLDFLRQSILALTNGKDIESSGRDFSSFFDGYNDGADEAADSTDNVKERIYTLLDYVSDLKKVMSDAFDFRFGLQQAKDGVTSTIQDISENFENAKKKVRDLKLEIQSLKATLSTLKAEQGTLEYFLAVAIEYGDTKRAAEIRAQMAENSADQAEANADLTDTQKDLTQAEKDAKPTLKGTSAAALAQRAAILQLVQGVEDQIAAYAAAGHTQEEVAVYAAQLKKQLEDQLVAWGYNRAEIETYTDAIDDFIVIIKELPRDLTVDVDANTSPADKALQEFFTKNKDKTITTTHKVVTKREGGSTKADRKQELLLQIERYESALAARYGREGNLSSGALALERSIRDLKKRLNSGDYSSGGYTGPGGKYEYAGSVHKGEYVIPKQYVNQSTGLPYADAYNRIAQGTRVTAPSYANGGHVTGGLNGTINLSAGTIQQIARAVQPYIVIDNKILGDASSRAYTNETRVGSN